MGVSSPLCRRLLLALPLVAGACTVPVSRIAIPRVDQMSLEVLARPLQDSQGQDELEALRKEAQQAADKAESAATPGNRPLLDLTALNPRITVFGDFVGSFTKGKLRDDVGDEIPDRFSLREAELDLRADIDPTAKGVAILAVAEEEPGEYAVEVEEMYATFESLPANMRLKVGRFRTAFGQYNRLHTHDLPQTTRPLASRTFLGEEGDREAGISLEHIVAWDGPPVRLIYELVNGENEASLAGSDAQGFAHIGRVTSFFDLTDASYLEIGGSLMAGEAEPNAPDTTYLTGVDVLLKLLPEDASRNTSFVFHAEGFHLDRSLSSGDIRSSGAFASAIYQFDRNWFAGVRGDWTEFNDADTGDANAVSAWLSYYTSEFLRVRVGYEALDDPRQPEVDGTFYLQLTFVLGAHPPHPYWVNL